jgi:hypothetical protein
MKLMRVPILFVQTVPFGISCQVDEQFALLQLKIALDLQSTVEIYDSVFVVMGSMGYIRSVRGSDGDLCRIFSPRENVLDDVSN